MELSGPAPIDPSRTELPEDWRALPAFLVEPGASLALKEVRRGEAEPPPDALNLARELWLDRMLLQPFRADTSGYAIGRPHDPAQ